MRCHETAQIASASLRSQEACVYRRGRGQGDNNKASPIHTRYSANRKKWASLCGQTKNPKGRTLSQCVRCDTLCPAWGQPASGVDLAVTGPMSRALRRPPGPSRIVRSFVRLPGPTWVAVTPSSRVCEVFCFRYARASGILDCTCYGRTGRTVDRANQCRASTLGIHVVVVVAAAA